jgi:heptosyltransferase-2/heptosyltransferase-3
LPVTEKAKRSVAARLSQLGVGEQSPLALIHPAAALLTKQWATENFARVTDAVAARGLRPVAIASNRERQVLDSLRRDSTAQVIGFDDLSLPEVTALAARARLFVGNDSGIAHIAAAAGAPCVVVFGSSNVAHWRPWTVEPNEVVREELACQPCHGYFCAEFDEPECIRRVPVQRVIAAVDRLLGEPDLD